MTRRPTVAAVSAKQPPRRSGRPARRGGVSSALPAGFQRCLRCGTDEAAGSYCTWCRTAEYELVVHRHKAKGGACPLGPYRNPGPALIAGKAKADAAAAFNRANPPDLSSDFITRRWTHNRKAAAA